MREINFTYAERVETACLISLLAWQRGWSNGIKVRISITDTILVLLNLGAPVLN